MKRGFFDYVRAAFNARPLGMLIPPNWIALAAFAMAGVMNPGFWLLGAGAELGYLFLLANNARFQRLVEGRHSARERAEWQQKMQRQVGYLDRADQQRYAELQMRCEGILEAPHAADAPRPGLEATAAGLSRLLWFYLRLLMTRRAITRVLNTDGGNERLSDLEDNIADVDKRLKQSSLTDELRASLEGQRAILKQRLVKRSEAAQKLSFIESELRRIEQQVGLIHDESALAASPEAMAHHIDEVAATMERTNQWIRDQQRLYGAIDDLIAEPPAAIVRKSKRESA